MGIWFVNPGRPKSRRSAARRKALFSSLTPKERRQYEHIKKSYQKRKDPRAKEIAARTVLAQKRSNPLRKKPLSKKDVPDVVLGRWVSEFLEQQKKKREKIVKKRSNPMARRKRRSKKLHGAAKAAFLKRMAKGRRKKHRKVRKNPAIATKAVRKRRKRKLIGGLKMARKKRKHRKVARKRHRRINPSKRVRRKRRKLRHNDPGKRVRRKRRKLRHNDPGKRVRRRRRYRRNPKHIGVKALRRARATIRYQKRRKGGKRARKYIRRYRLRTNPGMGGGMVKSLVGVLKAAAPLAGAYYLSRIASNKLNEMVASRVPAVLSTHTKPLVSLGMVVAANFATKKVKILGKYRTAVMLGAGLNLVDTLIKTYAPANVQAYLGDGGYTYERALSDYVSVGGSGSSGDYVETGAAEELAAEQELADYVTVGDDDGADLGAEQELGAAPFKCPPGSPWSRQLAALVAHRAMTAAVPARSVVSSVKEWSADTAKKDLYTGVFGGPKLC